MNSTYRAVQSFLQILLLAFSAIYLVMFLYMTFKTLGYPFQLEWMEGGTVRLALTMS